MRTSAKTVFLGLFDSRSSLVTHRFFCALLLLTTMMLSGFSLPLAAQPVSFQVFVSPDGDDKNSGLTAAEAILSLSRAQDILLDYQPQMPVEVIVAAGTYNFQSVNWEFTNDNEILFRASDENKTRPIFDGRGKTDTWFTLSAQTGKPSMLTFRHLRIENYNVGISFSGDRNHVGRGNSHNTLDSMYFYRIGASFSPKYVSYAAVRFVNSSYNEVKNSEFVDILNPDDRAHFIHAVYMAHHSSNNLVHNNNFSRINGDPIAVRDSANNNKIDNNIFEQTGTSAVFQDWYCQHGVDDCSKPTRECPSNSNELTNNLIGSGYYGAIEYVMLWRQDDYCGETSRPRVSVANNTGFARGISGKSGPAQPETTGGGISYLSMLLVLLALVQQTTVHRRRIR